MVACTLCIFIPRFFSILYEPNIDYRPFGPAVFLVVLFYDFVVMYLSSRERRVILEAVRSKCEQEFLSEDDSTAIITKWNSLNFWILALCQSGMAALGLYLSARLALFWGIPTALLGNMFFEIFELVFVVTQIAMLGCIALHCVIRSAVRACRLDA